MLKNEEDRITLDALEEILPEFYQEFVVGFPPEPLTEIERDTRDVINRFYAGLLRAATKEKARLAGTSEKPDLERRREMFIRHLSSYLAEGSAKQYMLSRLGDQKANEIIRLHGLAQIPRQADGEAIQKILTEFLS